LTNCTDNGVDNELVESIAMKDEEDQFEREVKEYLKTKLEILSELKGTQYVMIKDHEKGFYGTENNVCRTKDINSIELNDPKQWSLFASPKITSFKQGDIGDCWLIASFIALIEFPELLKKIFYCKNESINQTINEEGIYFLRFFYHGDYHSIIIDDCFPCNADRTLLQTKSNRKQLWPCLIEKAVARLFGGYGSLEEGGNPITGKKYNPKIIKLFNKILKY